MKASQEFGGLTFFPSQIIHNLIPFLIGMCAYFQSLELKEHFHVLE